MYYEESVIDGVLHHRHHPNGVWKPLSPTLMTNKYIASQMVIKELTEQVEQLIADSVDDTGLPTKKGSVVCSGDPFGNWRV